VHCTCKLTSRERYVNSNSVSLNNSDRSNLGSGKSHDRSVWLSNNGRSTKRSPHSQVETIDLYMKAPVRRSCTKSATSLRQSVDTFCWSRADDDLRRDIDLARSDRVGVEGLDSWSKPKVEYICWTYCLQSKYLNSMIGHDHPLEINLLQLIKLRLQAAPDHLFPELIQIDYGRFSQN
jgi:hypothetical protein